MESHYFHITLYFLPFKSEDFKVSQTVEEKKKAGDTKMSCRLNFMLPEMHEIRLLLTVIKL